MVRITKLEFNDGEWDIEWEADTEEEAELFRDYISDQYGRGFEDGQQHERKMNNGDYVVDDWYGYPSL